MQLMEIPLVHLPEYAIEILDALLSIPVLAANIFQV